MKGYLKILMFILTIGIFIVPMNVLADSVLVPIDGFTNVRIEMLRTDPTPLGPGENFDLYLSVETERRSGASSVSILEDVSIEFVDNSVFKLQSEEDAIQELGSMLQGEQTNVKYKVRVSGDAYEGTNGMNFIVSVGGREIESPELGVDIEVVDDSLSIYEISTDPEIFSPGSVGTLNIKVKNNANSIFRNLNAKLDTGVNVPIIPYKMTDELKLYQLDEGQSYTFSYDVIVEEDAEAGVYRVPFVLTYEDEQGNSYSKNVTFGVLISADADLSYNLEEFDTFQKNSKGKVVVSISNTGASESITHAAS